MPAGCLLSTLSLRFTTFFNSLSFPFHHRRYHCCWQCFSVILSTYFQPTLQHGGGGQKETIGPYCDKSRHQTARITSLSGHILETISLHFSSLPYFTCNNCYRRDSQIGTLKVIDWNTICHDFLLILNHFSPKQMAVYYAKIKSRKSKSDLIFLIGWLINEKTGCSYLRKCVPIYDSLRQIYFPDLCPTFSPLDQVFSFHLLPE